jgi:hypothetical protein
MCHSQSKLSRTKRRQSTYRATARTSTLPVALYDRPFAVPEGLLSCLTAGGAPSGIWTPRSRNSANHFENWSVYRISITVLVYPVGYIAARAFYLFSIASPAVTTRFSPKIWRNRSARARRTHGRGLFGFGTRQRSRERPRKNRSRLAPSSQDAPPGLSPVFAELPSFSTAA